MNPGVDHWDISHGFYDGLTFLAVLKDFTNSGPDTLCVDNFHLHKCPGRLGNMMWAYALMTALHHKGGYQGYLPRHALDKLNYYFKGIEKVQPFDTICEAKLPWVRLNFAVDRLIAEDELKTGHAWEIPKGTPLLSRNLCANMRWNKVFEGEEIYQMMEKAFEMRPKFLIHATTQLQTVRKTYNKSLKRKKAKQLHFVGVHIRRTDAIPHIVQLYGLPELTPAYYLKAMDLFLSKYKHVVFILVSDDMLWVEQNIKQRAPRMLTFLVGDGDPDNPDSIGYDMAVLTACNHTIASYGTFSYWASFLTSGHTVIPSMVFNNWGRGNPLDGEPVPKWAMGDHNVKYPSFEERAAQRMRVLSSPKT